MPDFRKVDPGDPLNISAAAWNASQDAARDYLSRSGGESMSGPLMSSIRPTITVLVRNDTGGDLDYPGVLALGEPVLSAVDAAQDLQQTPGFAGTEPESETDAFAIIIESVADGEFARGVVSGIAVCDVEVTDTTHEFATPTPGDATKMTSAASGPARIISIESGRGLKRAVVLICQGGGTGGAADPEACGWLIGLTVDSCLLSTVIAAYGRCSDIDTEQHQRLEWDAGESKYKSGDGAADTPEDDFAYDGPAIGPIRFWMDDLDPRASIDDVEGIKVGCGSDYVDFAFGGALCTGETVDPCGKNYFVVRFTCTCCTATPGWDGSGKYCVEDADSANGKACVELLTDPCDDTVILSGPYDADAECEDACCEIAGWGGAGWYCVYNGTDCEPLELVADDSCDDTITICSGPYASEALAIAGCGAVCCPDGTTLTFSLAGITNTATGSLSGCDCPLFDRSYSVTLAGGTGDSTTTGGATCDGQLTTFARVTCSGEGVALTFFTAADSRATYSTSRIAWDCNGDNVLTLTPEAVPLCTGFPATITLTATPP
jgi:hypothetical protein